MTHTLPNGVTLDDQYGMAPDLQWRASRLGLEGVRVFLATQSDGRKSYLLVEGETPTYESQQAEAIYARIDMMAADRSMPR